MDATPKFRVLGSTEYHDQLDQLDRLDRAEAITGIQHRLMSKERGEGMPPEDALDRLRSELGIVAHRFGATEPGADT